MPVLRKGNTVRGSFILSLSLIGPFTLNLSSGCSESSDPLSVVLYYYRSSFAHLQYSRQVPCFPFSIHVQFVYVYRARHQPSGGQVKVTLLLLHRRPLQGTTHILHTVVLQVTTPYLGRLCALERK